MDSPQPAPAPAVATAGFRQEALDGFRAAVPLAVAVVGFGVSFGILARTAHMGWIATLAMSGTTFAGSAQFAAVSVLGTGGGVAAAVTAAVLLNCRYLPIGISVAPAVTGGVVRRLLSAQLVVDESWAIGHVGGGRYSLGRMMGAGALMYVAWVGGTAAGLLGGEFLGDPARYGLDVVAPSLFLALLIGRLRGRQAVVASVLGATIALTLVPLTSPGVPLLAAATACLVGLRAR
jgi:4-azaleucine resistance transporter AzlC